MRLVVIPVLALALTACSPAPERLPDTPETALTSALEPPVRHVGERCVYSRQRPVAFSTARDTLSVSIDADQCREAAVVLEIRDPVGALMATDSFPLRDHAAPGESFDFTDAQDMLETIIDDTRGQDARALPSVEDATGLTTASPEQVRLHTSRAVYDRAREIGGPVLCWPVRRNATKCIWLNPETRETTALYGAPRESAG